MTLPLRRKLRFVNTRLREWRMIARGLASKRHPVLAHLIPIRRCNLSCTYCNEFDNFSKPVALRRHVPARRSSGRDWAPRLLRLAEASRCCIRTWKKSSGAFAATAFWRGLITNGYLLTPQRIEHLNRAGLDHLQISIDNVQPDEVSKKSLKVLDRKLQMLARYAIFQVNINSVLGSPVRHPDDALAVARRALELGFTSTVGILHDHDGQLQPLGEHQQRALRADHADGQALLRALQPVSEEHLAGRRQRLAMPRRQPLSLHLRGRPGALLLAATRLSGHPAGEIHAATTWPTSTTRRNPARRIAPFPACSKSPCSTIGVRPKPAPALSPWKSCCRIRWWKARISAPRRRYCVSAPVSNNGGMLTRNNLRLTLDGALAILAAAEKKAGEIKVPQNIAVVDEGGHLLAFARMDGAKLSSVEVSLTKARAAALRRAPTGPAPTPPTRAFYFRWGCPSPQTANSPAFAAACRWLCKGNAWEASG